MRPAEAPPDPEWGDPRARRRFALVMFLVGAILCAISPVLPADPDPSDHGRLRLMALLMATATVLVAVLPPTRAVARWSVRGGIVLLSAVVTIAMPVGGVPYFYVWPVLYAAMLLPRSELHLAIVLVAVTLGVAILGNEGEIGFVVYLGAATSATGVGLVVRMARDRSTRLEGELRHAARTDPLTDLANRRAFDHGLEEACPLASPERPLTLVLLDVDGFKAINDEHGHAVGDRTLVTIARALRGAADDGVAARIGGEELALVLPGRDVPAARRAVVRFAEALAEPHAPDLPDDVVISACAGIATSRGGMDPDAMLHVADDALYAAKAEGRGRVVVGRSEGEGAAPGSPGPVAPRAPA